MLKGSNLFKEICLGLIFAFMITRFVAPTFVVGNSMHPTLHNGNYLLINKIAYKLQNPKQYDIIVFKSNIKGHKILVKRIIAVPGDRVKILNGKVYMLLGILLKLKNIQKSQIIIDLIYRSD